MELKVIKEVRVVKEHIADLVEIDDLENFTSPIHYQLPFYIIMTGKNVVAKFYFLTKREYTRDNGKRIYFSMDISVAQEFDDFKTALDLATRFKRNDDSGIEKFYVIGFAEAKIVEMYIQQEKEKFDKMFPH